MVFPIEMSDDTDDTTELHVDIHVRGAEHLDDLEGQLTRLETQLTRINNGLDVITRKVDALPEALADGLSNLEGLLNE